MKVGHRSRTAIVMGMMLLGMSAKAHATVASPLSVWRFFGNCVDCGYRNNVTSYAVTATLTLQNYMQGATLNNSNFVSFVYNGSNLLPTYTVPSVSLAFVGLVGNLTNGGSENIELTFGSGGYFRMQTYRSWQTCTSSCDTNDDYGNIGNLVLDGPRTIPEPGTYALLVFGLGSLGVAGKLKGRTR